MAATEARAVPTYGGWGRPDRGGLGKMSTLATMLIVLGPIFAVLVFLAFAWVSTLVYLGVWGLLMLALAVRDRHNRTILHRTAARVGFVKGKSTGASLYRSGPLSRVPFGKHMLPGLLASSKLTEHVDAYDRPFGLIHYPSTRHYALTVACEPDGLSLVDQSTVDQRVAQWGHWLAALSTEPGLHAASVTVETTPDSGARLRREVSARLRDDSPQLAREMYAEIVENYPAGSAQVRAWVTLVFRGGTRRRRTADEVAVEVSSRLPELTANLAHAGAGTVVPVTAQGLCELVRTAYDPAAGRLIEAAHADSEVPELSWDECGPVTAIASWDTYRHDSGVSRTWEMTSAPKGEVYSHVLGRLLEPTPGVDRKRVTLTYRPYDPARAATTVERDVDKADFRVTGSRRPTARARSAQSAARRTADEESRGAGLVSFDMLITATVGEAESMPDAAAIVDALATSARLQARPVNGSQDTAFAACLPIGVVLGDHSRIAAAAREML